MNILIVNSAEPDIKEFTNNIKRHISKEKASYQIIDYRKTTDMNMDDYDGVIISGSPQGDDIVEHHQPYFQWIKTISKPIMGICAGHHITAFMHGGKYLRGVEPESGDFLVKILKDDPLFDKLPNPITARQMHNDSVTLPKGFTHLAKSTVCFNQAMRHEQKPLYSLQFHPEYLNPEIICNFVKICEEKLLFELG